MYTRGLRIHWMSQHTDFSMPLIFPFISSSRAIASAIRGSKKKQLILITSWVIQGCIAWGEEGYHYTSLTYHHVSRFAVHKLQSLLQTKMQWCKFKRGLPLVMGFSCEFVIMVATSPFNVSTTKSYTSCQQLISWHFLFRVRQKARFPRDIDVHLTLSENELKTQMQQNSWDNCSQSIIRNLPRTCLCTPSKAGFKRL